MAVKYGATLPTINDLRASGVNAGDGNDLWMPVHRDDGVGDDFVQIGEHPGRKGVRYFSHKDEYGPTQWQESPYPDTWRPSEYIYVKVAGTSA